MTCVHACSHTALTGNLSPCIHRLFLMLLSLQFNQMGDARETEALGACLSFPADTISACLWDFCLTRPALVWPDLEIALAVLRGGALRCPDSALFRPDRAAFCGSASPALTCLLAHLPLPCPLGACFWQMWIKECIECLDWLHRRKWKQRMLSMLESCMRYAQGGRTCTARPFRSFRAR